MQGMGARVRGVSFLIDKLQPLRVYATCTRLQVRSSSSHRSKHSSEQNMIAALDLVAQDYLQKGMVDDTVL
jgi:hypothetical protein